MSIYGSIACIHRIVLGLVGVNKEMDIFDTLKYVEIETNSSCTRKCDWCLFGVYPNNRPSKIVFLSDAAIYSVLEDLARSSFRGVIGFFSINEPLLDPRITSGELFQACKEIFKDKVLVEITTNGDLLTKDIVQTMFRQGLNGMKISCYDKERYSEMKDLYGHMDDIYILDQTRYKLGNFESNRGGSIGEGNFLATHFSSCFYPYYRTAIGWDGEVRICYNDILQTVHIGNIYQEKISLILRSKQFSKFREMLVNHRQIIEPCCKCNVKGDCNKLNLSNAKILDKLSKIKDSAL